MVIWGQTLGGEQFSVLEVSVEEEDMFVDGALSTIWDIPSCTISIAATIY